MSILSKQSVQRCGATQTESCLSSQLPVSELPAVPDEATASSVQSSEFSPAESSDRAIDRQSVSNLRSRANAVDSAASDKLAAVKINEMPADIATQPAVALTNTALSSSHLTAEQQQQSLQMLAAHPLLHSGDLTAAARVITTTTATMIQLDRVSLWRFTEGKLQLVDRYDRRQDTHVQAVGLPLEVCKAYLEGTGIDCASNTSSKAARDDLEVSSEEHRADLAIEDVSSAVSLQLSSALDCLAQHSLLLSSPGAFLEVAIRCQGKVVGFLWGEQTQAHRWTTLEKTMALSVSLLAAAALGSVEQTALSSVLNKQHRQLQRETIEREQAEQAWQESQRFIQGIIDASTNILYVDNFIDGSNIYISRWIMNVLGYEAYEVQKLGSQYLEKLVHADEKTQMIAGRKKLSAINDGEVVENEYRFRHRQGNWRWLLCRETVFQRDANGQPTQVFGTATDITKRKHAEVALKEFNHELERLASMDGLTQVANRRSFDSYLAQEWQNVGSGRSSLSLILCDIDYFKSFNDTYGHQAGDVCLRRVAQAIERAVKRSTDLVARYGGEEFAVILPNTGSKSVEQVAKEIQEEIQQLDIPHSQSGVSNCITMSLGIAVVSSTKNGHPDMLVAAADQGLYQAKYEGRDRYCIGELDMPQSL